MSPTDLDIVEVVRSYGHTLIPAGNEWKLLCPFHGDTVPSLYLTPENNLWICFGCQKGGSAIQWVAYEEKISFAEAAEKLGIELNPLHELQGRILRLQQYDEAVTIQEDYQFMWIATWARKARLTLGFDQVERLLARFDDLDDRFEWERMIQYLERTGGN